jgi:hypothetical protein
MPLAHGVYRPENLRDIPVRVVELDRLAGGHAGQTVFRV